MSRHVLPTYNPNITAAIIFKRDKGYYVETEQIEPPGIGVDSLLSTLPQERDPDGPLEVDPLKITGLLESYTSPDAIRVALRECVLEMNGRASNDRTVDHRTPREPVATILDTTAHALVVPVNLQGVMGKGLAKAAADRWPALKPLYIQELAASRLTVGQPTLIENPYPEGPLYFVLAPTKRTWREHSRLDDIESLLPKLRALCDQNQLDSIAIPGLGTGLGQLKPADVNPKIEAAFANCDSVVHAYFDDQPRILNPDRGRRLARDIAQAARTQSMEPMKTGPGLVREAPATEPARTAAPTTTDEHDVDPFRDRTLPDEPARRPSVPTARYHKNWFSNFEPFEVPLVEDGLAFSSPEHYYQAMKCTNVADRRKLSTTPGDGVLLTPGQAKRYVRNVPCVPEREDVAWLESVMEKALRHKYAPGTAALATLMGTGREEIVEWNNWGDKRWGRDLATGLGENRLGILTMKLREEFRERGLDKDIVRTPATDHAVPAEKTFIVTGIGMSELAPASEEARYATQTIRRIKAAKEREGYHFILRSGGAPGADTACERGVVRMKTTLRTDIRDQYRDVPLSMLPPEVLEYDATSKQIVRPAYEASWERHPPGTVFASDVNTKVAQTIAAALHGPYEWDEKRHGAQAMLTRNVVQYLGPHLNRKPDLVVCLAKPIGDSVEGGSRIVWDLAGGKVLDDPTPRYNILDPKDREALSSAVREMELAAGIRFDGPELAKEWPTFRVAYEIPPSDRAVDPTKEPILLGVHNVKSLPPKLDESFIYCGRNGERAEEVGIKHVPALSNDFHVGQHGHQGQCVEYFAGAFAKRCANNSQATLTGLQTITKTAIEEGKLNLVCHCAPYACHCHVVIGVVGDRLERAGYAVDYRQLPVQEIRRFIAEPAVRQAAVERLRRDDYPEIKQVRTPWTVIQGTVLAADDVDVAIETGNGSFRLLSREQLPDVALGESVTLRHGRDGSAQIVRSDEVSRDRVQKHELSLSR